MKLLVCLLFATAACTRALSWPWKPYKEQYESCRHGGCSPRTVLGVGPFASLDIITTEYKRLSLIVHPDKQGGSAQVYPQSLCTISTISMLVSNSSSHSGRGALCTAANLTESFELRALGNLQL
jgi:hypothetical protein